MAASGSTASVGTEFQQGRVKLLDVLGTGGFSTVYLADVDGDQLAVKLINSAAWADYERPALLGLFENECHYMETLPNPVVPRFHSSFAEGDYRAIIMEAIPGLTLQQHITTIGTLGLIDFHSLASRLTGALCSFHHPRERLVFGDLKPSNIIHTPSGDFRLVDLGSVWPHGEKLPGDINIISENFSAPERLHATPSLLQHDLYSYAATLFFALTGVEPEPEMDFEDLEGVLRLSVSLLDRQWSDQRWHRFEQFLTLVLAALERDPKARPQCISNFARAMERLQPAEYLDGWDDAHN